METYEVFYDVTQQGDQIEKIKWTSEGLIIDGQMIPIESIDWCNSIKDSRGNKLNKLEFTMRDGEPIYFEYDEADSEKAERMKKGLRDAIDKIDSEIAHNEAKAYCEVFEDEKSVVKGKWTYDGMLIGNKMIPVEEIDDCRFMPGSSAYYLLFDLKNGKTEKFELENEEQYEQGRNVSVMVTQLLKKFESGEWVKE